MSSIILLRFKDLKERGIVSTWASLLRWVDTADFPPGRKIAPNTRVWTEAEIDEWFVSRPLAGGKKNKENQG